MEQYAEAKLHRFAREATRSLELGAKAVLAKIDPVLIADPRYIESQLYLAGHPVARTRSEAVIRTISCEEALKRVAAVAPALRVQDADRLISVRNGSTHYLVGDREGVESLVIAFLATFQVLQQQLELSDENVFGPYTDLVRLVRERHTEEVDRKVAAKIAHAKHAFDERYGHLDANAKKVVLQTIEASIVLDGYDEQSVPCPACKSVGVTSGQHEFDRWEVDVDEDGSAHGYPVVNLFAGGFKCRTCGLHLESADELAAAGLDTVLDVNDVDPEDFYDEDDYGDDWRDG